MIDPDAPSRSVPICRSFKHWAVINIPGSDVESGSEICVYRGPGPPRATGFHRYVFLVYEQTNGRIEYNGSIFDW